jgi:predicted nucleic acid-binding protein
MGWLLDTNVISELRKPKAERKVLEFVSSTPLSGLYISVVSLAEIRYGIEVAITDGGRSEDRPYVLAARPLNRRDSCPSWAYGC